MGALTKVCFTLLVAIAFAGCAQSFQGIRMRASSPAIDEAYKGLVAAANAEGFTARAVDPRRHSFETGWRELRIQETILEDHTGWEGRLSIRLEVRGAMYDIFLNPWIRPSGDTLSAGTVAPPPHPFRMRWQKVLRLVVTPEAKEED